MIIITMLGFSYNLNINSITYSGPLIKLFVESKWGCAQQEKRMVAKTIFKAK